MTSTAGASTAAVSGARRNGVGRAGAAGRTVATAGSTTSGSTTATGSTRHRLRRRRRPSRRRLDDGAGGTVVVRGAVAARLRPGPCGRRPSRPSPRWWRGWRPSRQPCVRRRPWPPAVRAAVEPAAAVVAALARAASEPAAVAARAGTGPRARRLPASRWAVVPVAAPSPGAATGPCWCLLGGPAGARSAGRARVERARERVPTLVDGSIVVERSHAPGASVGGIAVHPGERSGAHVNTP